MPNETPAPEMKMQPDEFAELRAQVAVIAQQDVHLGRVLNAMLLHLGHAHDLDPTVEDAKAKAEAKQAARAAEDARLKAEADARIQLRAAEDAQRRSPLEREVLLASRAAEDAQVKADAMRRTLARAEEDGTANAPDNVAVAPVEPEAPLGETPA